MTSSLLPGRCPGMEAPVLRPAFLRICACFLTLALLLLAGSRWMSARALSLPQTGSYLAPPAPVRLFSAPVPITITASADAYVSSGSPTANYGTSDELHVGRGGWSGSAVMHTFVRFDLSAIPADAHIESAELWLYLRRWSGNGSYAVQAYSLNADWAETGITWNNQPSAVELVEGRDVGRPAGYKTWTIRTDLVQQWADGTRANYGLVLVPGPALGWDLTFNSREYRSNRPYLLLSYSGGTPSATQTATPTPTHSSTRTVTATPTPSRTGTAAASPTATRTATGTGTATVSPTTTTPTPSTTPTLIGTPTVTRTATGTPTAPPSVTPTPAPCSVDAWESNDTFETAYFVFPGLLQGLICPSTDVDYFRFSANQYDWITLDLSSLPADYELQLWDPHKELLEQSIHGGTASEQIVIIAPYTGSYRALVLPATGQWHATDTYELRIQVTSATPVDTVTRTPTAGTPTPGATLTRTATPTVTRTPTVVPTLTPASCGTDVWEPNDTFETAYFVFSGTLQGLICPSGDVDWFRFSANQYGRITLDLTGLAADYNLRLWKPDGTPLAESAQAGMVPEQIVRTAPVGGSYRVEVWPASGQWHASSTYSLRVQVVSTTAWICLPVLLRNHGP